MSVLAAGVGVLCSNAALASSTLASKGDAAVVYDAAGQTWSIGVGSATLTVGLDASHSLSVRRGPLPTTAGPDTPSPDMVLTANGQQFALTEAGTGLHSESVLADETATGVHVAFTYTHSVWRATIARHYAAYPGSPVVEAWTTVQVADGAAPLVVTDLTGWRRSVPAGTVRWVNGLRGDGPDNPVDDAFSIGARDLANDEVFSIGADGRSSEHYLPLVTIDEAGGRWFSGVQWSGQWRIDCARIGSRIDVSVIIPDTTTTVTAERPLEIPHMFIGFVAGGAADVARALRGFPSTGVRAGRPIRPLITFNTWYPYGARIDEHAVLDEIDRTSALGVELFVLDAGWYPGAGARGFYDFETGLGTWTVDPERFPSGLRALADRAHERGMKFGLWVEPGRVSLDTVGADGLAVDAWLAQNDGQNVSATSGKICYGTRAARDWVRARLFALLDDVRPDYLKWDNNAWINCNRTNHDHGALDGNLRQVEGLYRLLQDVRDRYPGLIVENVAGGGSRMDFGIVRYTDVAWMDDRTWPAVRVRHNLQGVSRLFPPGYLLSFVVDSLGVPLGEANDPLTEIRSSMMGALGFGYRSPLLRPWLADAFRDTIRAYAGIRDVLQDADAILLSDQVPSPDPGWDAVEVLASSVPDAVLFVYHQPDADDRTTVRPRGLDADAIYSVTSLDAGDLGTARGGALMNDGIEVVQGSGTQSHILVLRRARAE